MSLKELAIRNSMRNSNPIQESQQSVNSSSDSSLPLTSVRRSSYTQQSNITSIPENTEDESSVKYDFGDDDNGKKRTLRKSASCFSFKRMSNIRRHSVGAISVEHERFDSYQIINGPCCNPEIVAKVNKLLPEEIYEIVPCKKAQSDNGVRKWYQFDLINKFKNKNLKVICGQGYKNHVVTAKRIKDGKIVVIKRVVKENLTQLDYLKRACNKRASCECVECVIKSQPSPPASILSTRSSNTNAYSFSSQYSRYTGRSNSLPARHSLLMNSFTLEQNSSTSSIIKTVSIIESDLNEQLQNYYSPQNSPQTSILSNSPPPSIHNNSPRTSIINNSPPYSIYSNNNSTQFSIYNNPSHNSIYNINNINSSPSLGSPPIHAQIDKLKRKSTVSFTSSSASNNFRSSALSIKSASSNSSMSAQPPSLHSVLILNKLLLNLNSNELPDYIGHVDDDKYYYYITKRHGVRQRKFMKPSSWF